MDVDAPRVSLSPSLNAHTIAARRVEREKRREERQEKKRKIMLQQGGWKAIQLLSAESVFWEGDLLGQALTILCSELKQQLHFVNEAAGLDDSTQQGERGGIAFELLSLLFMLSHTPVAKDQIAQWDNVATLVGLLTCAHAAPRAKRIALRLALRFLPHAEPPSQDSFLSLLDYFLDAIGSCLFDQAATSRSTSSTPITASAQILSPNAPITTATNAAITSFNDFSSNEDDESDDEGEGLAWDDGEDVDMYEGEEGEDDEEEAAVDEAAEQEADLYSVYLDVWTTGYKRCVLPAPPLPLVLTSPIPPPRLPPPFAPPSSLLPPPHYILDPNDTSG